LLLNNEKDEKLQNKKRLQIKGGEIAFIDNLST
jgi:hypothetical protein